MPARPRVWRIPALLRYTIVFGLGSTLMLTRFQLNFGGGLFLNVGTMAQYLFIMALLAYGFARIDPIRLLLLIACGCVSMVSLVANSDVASKNSVLLFAVAYLAWIFVARNSERTEHLSRWTLAVFGNLMMVCAVAGILQFFLQFVIKDYWLLDYTSYLPEVIRGGGAYNTVIPVNNFFKSNGFFFREPSTFSQFLALALLCEFATQKRWRPVRLATLGLALLLSYSGTGLLTLFIGLLFPLGRKTVFRLILLAIAAAVILSPLGDALNLSFTAGRIGEFSYAGSSGFARFVAPFMIVRNYLDATPWSLLIGFGPGTIFRIIASAGADFQIADPTWAKLFIEYGVLGFIAIAGLFLYSILKSRAPSELRAGIAFGWLVIWGGILLAPDITSILFMLVAVWPRPPAPKKQPLSPPVATAQARP
ncbi:hypothetical protein [Dongia sedimenti]|uniref:Polymerase n=1 Tax=Dongia sedimenti TaxID=3064282 RepID=A0ABU0YSU1_9PROT|nr:hypothetical protein [Rhodospirillaceae bacterium R-7]